LSSLPFAHSGTEEGRRGEGKKKREETAEYFWPVAAIESYNYSIRVEGKRKKAKKEEGKKEGVPFTARRTRCSYWREKGEEKKGELFQEYVQEPV